MRKILSIAGCFLFTHAAFAVPTAALTFDTNVLVTNASDSQTAKLRAAEQIIKDIVATEEFRSAVLNHTYNGVKKFVDNEGLTNLEIYNKILEGAEELSPDKNNSMDLQVQLYYNRWTSTVGYTTPSSTRIYMNTKFFNYYTPAEVSRNMIHEWLHKVGFSHASSYSTSRDYSVPYAIGSIMERLAKNLGSSTGGSTGGSTDTVFKPVANLTLTKTATAVTLKWGASSGAKEYKVYRKLDGSSTFYLQGTTTNLLFMQNLPSKSAQYYIKAVSTTGATAKSDEVRLVRY